MSWFKYMFGGLDFTPTDNAGRTAVTDALNYDDYKREFADFVANDIKERVARNAPKKRKPRGYCTPQTKSRQTKFLKLLAKGKILTNMHANELFHGIGERELREAITWLELNGVKVEKVKQHSTQIVNKYLTIANQKKAQKLLGEKVDVSC
jgi:hypothetical protein